MSKAKINFKLQQDQEGYPPVAVETVWAQKAEPEGFFLDNIPFFEREATLGDLVFATERDAVLWFERIIKPSGNSLLRLVFFDNAPMDQIRQEIRNLGCESELFQEHMLLAINVPPEQSLKTIQEYLASAAARGWIDYEEPILRHPANR